MLSETYVMLFDLYVVFADGPEIIGENLEVSQFGKIEQRFNFYSLEKQIQDKVFSRDRKFMVQKKLVYRAILPHIKLNRVINPEYNI